MQLRCPPSLLTWLRSLPRILRVTLDLPQALELDDAWFIQAYPDIELEPGVALALMIQLPLSESVALIRALFIWFVPLCRAAQLAVQRRFSRVATVQLDCCLVAQHRVGC